ncbi:MAG: glycosyltransferase family 2 protein [Pseudomonadales bacterium]
MRELSLVIPVFNEADIIVAAVDTILTELKSIDDLDYFELIIVDDGSSDGTWKLLIEVLCPRYPEIRAIKLSRNFGKESALCAGLELCDAQATIIMDADLQHPPALIKDMLGLWREGSVDIVDAVKRDRGDEPAISRLSANGFYAVFERLSGVGLKNASDFKLLDKRVVAAWREMPEKNLFFRGMSAWVGFNRKEIQFDVAPRLGSDSKWSTLGLFRLALTSIVSFSSAPLHLITLSGVGFILFSIVLGVITVARHFSGEAVSGFATVILLLLIIGGVIMVSLGIIGEYLARIYNEVKARPRYLIADDSRDSKIERDA